ncbi:MULTISPECIES: hypothetical protein [unclassified Archaeoglobus]|jgi:hypothetical protein|uniref:hypothetical protein n=1 Tax=unclassified Archaeoglobus TaxID=2643606 RepID=UPI0025BA5062|nr:MULTISPECIES: hypothetical protein [unclassified Archaeoglobus]
MSSQRIEGEKIRCVGRKISKPRLIHQTGKRRAVEIFVEGRPAKAEVVKAWRVIKQY